MPEKPEAVESNPAAKKVGNTTQSLYLPVRVLFEDENNKLIQEIGRTNYISANRATIPLRRKLPLGTVVRLALPLPVSWRKHSFTEPVYVISAEVVAVTAQASDFLTEFKFLSDRDALRRRRDFEARSKAAGAQAGHKQIERRVEVRFTIPIEVSLEMLDDFGSVVHTERSVTENISQGGACVKTTYAVRCGDIIRISAKREGFKTRAVVKHTYLAPDQVRRVNIQFMDAQWKV